jgi:hypothetical protein
LLKLSKVLVYDAVTPAGRPVGAATFASFDPDPVETTVILYV